MASMPWRGAKAKDDVAAEERSEAAIGGVAVVKPASRVSLVQLSAWTHDGFAADRSLASLVSGYRF